jgi:hypothetical protein
MGDEKFKWLNRLKSIFLFLSLFYITVYIPLVLIAYPPYWYRINCNWHPRCEKIGYDRAAKGINDLSSFFLHKGELVSFWTQKEKLHLAEVRDIFDKMFFISLLSIVILIVAGDRRLISKFAWINIGIIICFLLVLPFFGTFWRDIFHPLLFDNKLWLNNIFDLSYYLMPRQFFKYSLILLIFMSCFLNLAIWFLFRKKL